MKRLSIMMIILSTLIISTLNSCSKEDSLHQTQVPPDPHFPMTLNLVADHWQNWYGETTVSIFKNVVPTGIRIHSVMVYLVENGKDVQINQPILHMGGLLWANNTDTDIMVYLRGNTQNVAYLNVKAIIE